MRVEIPDSLAKRARKLLDRFGYNGVTDLVRESVRLRIDKLEGKEEKIGRFELTDYPTPIHIGPLDPPYELRPGDSIRVFTARILDDEEVYLKGLSAGRRKPEGEWKDLGDKGRLEIIDRDNGDVLYEVTTLDEDADIDDTIAEDRTNIVFRLVASDDNEESIGVGCSGVLTVIKK